jgi:alpha-D-glucose phosphate-specific phosphoglucomutase
MTIKFGTDGWRAVISETFTFGNLRLVSQAIANYILEEYENGGTPEVVIGFDTRFLSDRYALEVARVMAGNGIVSWLTRADAPTPCVSYNVVHKKAAAGVMITASHNAPRYNGVKLKSAKGCSATPEACRHVENLIERTQEMAIGPNMMDYNQAVEKNLIRRFDPAWAYYEHLSGLIDFDLISSSELRIVADSMYGAGRACFRELLSRTRCRINEIRGEMNPGFGGIHPEPIERYLNALVAAVKANQADVGLATDGDADRTGAVNADGEFIDPHHIMALTMRYLIEKRGWSGDAAKTVSTTMMIDRLAKKYGRKVYETPVGFNHIADLMLSEDILIGGEESGGISIKNHIPEGDGILMGLLLLEIMADAHAPLKELVRDLQATAGPAVYRREDVTLKHQLTKKEMVNRLAAESPSTIAGESVAKVDTMDGIKYRLADDSWLLIRPSGTEPVLRFYAEASSSQAVNELLATGKKLAWATTGDERLK